MTRTACGLLGLLLSLLGCEPRRPAAPTTTEPMSAYDHMLRVLYKHSVPLVRPAALVANLVPGAPAVVLLDTRSRAEYEVSHLRGARFVAYEQFRSLELEGWPRNQPIVVYCTVGARSEQVGSWLQEQGFENVRNLYGGIFQWVNEGYEVVNAQGPTAHVHPYSALWRPWLKQGTPAYE